MAYVQATQKAALKTAITDKLTEKGMAPLSEGDDQLDAICDAITAWLGDVLPDLTVTVPGTGLTSPAGAVEGTASGTIS